MKVSFSGLRRPARVAKLIQHELSHRGVEIGLCQAQEISARAFGYDTFHELRQLVGKEDPSAWDEDCPQAVSEARRARQVGALVRSGIEDGTAREIVARIKPSSRHLGSRLEGIGPSVLNATGFHVLLTSTDSPGEPNKPTQDERPFVTPKMISPGEAREWLDRLRVDEDEGDSDDDGGREAIGAYGHRAGATGRNFVIVEGLPGNGKSRSARIILATLAGMQDGMKGSPGASPA